MYRIAVKEPVLYMTKAPKNDLMREKNPWLHAWTAL